jgi:hypothetical protein
MADFNPRTKRLMFALTLTGLTALIQPATALICVLILFVWMLWEFDVLGGVDAVAALTLILIYPKVTFILAFLGVHVIATLALAICSLLKRKSVKLHKIPGLPL